jgi:MscS family membrane protein
MLWAMEKTEKFLNSYVPFWTEVTDVWNHGLFGVDIGSIIIAVLIFTGFLILRGFIARFILSKLVEWSQKTTTKIDDAILPCLIPPIKFIPIILGVFFAGQYMGFSSDADEFFGRVVRSMIAFTIFWALYLGAEPLGHSMKRLERLLTPMMTQWIFKVMKMVIMMIGGAVILETWGIKVAPLLAGLGLFGAAIALGAQDFFKNLIAGASLISEKRFLNGDWILVEGVVEGTVEEIGFRSTRIRRFDKAPIYVPNNLLTDSVVTNFSRMTYRRIRWILKLTQKTTTKQLKTICDGIEAYIKSNTEHFAQPPDAPLTVRIDAFGDQTIDILINCFTKTIDYNEWVNIKQELAFKVKEIVEEKAKASFMAPATSIIVENPESQQAKTPDANKTRAKNDDFPENIFNSRKA